jgi:putative acetyltransferase
VTIRPERPEDLPAVDRLRRAAFGGDAEARLVDALRGDGAVLSLVADEDGVVGHLMFSRLEMDGVRAAALAPVAVAPARQRRGTGSALIRDGLRRLREAGWEAVVVLGEPAYYARFGFVPAPTIACPYSGPYLQGVELIPGALAVPRTAVYAAPFARLG